MSAEPPRTPPERRAPRTAPSLVLVHTGDGEGKSTAAFGTARRAVARGWPVAVVQFLGSGDWHVGEEAVCPQLGIEWFAAGDGSTWDADDLDESRAGAVPAWRFAADLLAEGRHRLLVLDEITYPVTWGWIDGEEVAEAVRRRQPSVSVVLTGRDAVPALLAVADTATEVRELRHAYDHGILAKKGIDH